MNVESRKGDQNQDWHQRRQYRSRARSRTVVSAALIIPDRLASWQTLREKLRKRPKPNRDISCPLLRFHLNSCTEQSRILAESTSSGVGFAIGIRNTDRRRAWSKVSGKVWWRSMATAAATGNVGQKPMNGTPKRSPSCTEPWCEPYKFPSSFCIASRSWAGYVLIGGEAASSTWGLIRLERSGWRGLLQNNRLQLPVTLQYRQDRAGPRNVGRREGWGWFLPNSSSTGLSLTTNPITSSLL